MKTAHERLALFALSWILFYALSTFIVARLDDIGAGYWMLGAIAFPIFLVLFQVTDRRMVRSRFASRNPGAYLALMCLTGMLMYWPGMLLVVWVGLALFA